MSNLDRRKIMKAARRLADHEQRYRFCCSALFRSFVSQKTQRLFKDLFAPPDAHIYPAWFGYPLDQVTQDARLTALLLLREMIK